MQNVQYRRILLFLAFLSVPTTSGLAQSTQPAPPMPEPIQFTTETLPNGLQVIYAPLHNAPVVHVRVLYHVGSRDERPDRQGFAHMFEHMMFRGSAHVAPEEHMKLIGEVGGISNAFTSFDQTTYHDTIPSLHTQMALYLEADRMASFKVSDDIFKTERKVVSEEWRWRNANPPYGQLFQDFAKTAYINHSYRWTPIGDMDQLRMSTSAELQSFFNKYYIPNNACLIVAGDIDTEQTKGWVHDYFGWIPKGPEIQRDIAQEPVQTEARHLSVKKFVPLPRVVMGYKTTTYTSDDHYALSLLADILGSGRTSRLYKQLVDSQTPLCISADANDEQQEDLSLFLVEAGVLPGKKADLVEQTMQALVTQMADKPVTDDELNLAKTQERVAIIRGRETCTQIATALGEAAVFGHDPNRVNNDLEKLDAVTPEMIQAVAKKYLQPSQLTTVEYIPDPLNTAGRSAAATQVAKATALAAAPVVASTQPIEPRISAFPPGYPEHPPISLSVQKAVFNKGVTQDIGGQKLITLHDARLPLVNFGLILRRGGYSEPIGKEGLASLTASMLRRGAGDLDAAALAQDLESRGIEIEASDSGDTTRINGSCTVDQLDHAIDRLRDIVLKPTFPEDEFEKLKQQTVGDLTQSLANPDTVVLRLLTEKLFGEHTPLGRSATPASVAGITLSDVSAFYQSIYRPDDAIFVMSGDVTPEQAKIFADRLLANWKPAGSLAEVNYALPAHDDKLRITLVDNPPGKQSAIRMGVRAYDLHSDEKFPGLLAGAILSNGIDSRLNKYVRAEKGYTYGASGLFDPQRHDGSFVVNVDTNPDTTGPCVQACWKVLGDVTTGGVTDEELRQSKRRVSGSLVMGMQTIAQQATRRAEMELNGYPLDYYDVLPDRIAKVTPDDVKNVLAKYAQPGAMEIVVVGPAAQIQPQLEALGPVTVAPMPLKREAATMPSNEMMKPTTRP